MTTRRNKNNSKRNIYSRAKQRRNKKLTHAKTKPTIPLILFTLDASNNFVVKQNSCNTNDISAYNDFVSSLDKKSHFIKKYSFNIKNEKNEKNEKKYWHYTRNKLTEKYNSISINNRFSGWSLVYNISNYIHSTPSYLNIPTPSNDDLLSIKKNSGENNNYKLCKGFQRWKASTDFSKKTYYIQPTITNGYMFNNFKPQVSTTHQKLTLPSPPKKKVTIDVKIHDIADLLMLIEKYPIQIDIEYNINMQAIHNIAEPLTRLNNMVGINIVKSSIVDQIIYYIQKFHTLGCNKNDFMHTVIYGPPGTGKTEIAKCIGEIFCKLGVLNKNIFKKVTRSDLIAGYLGQTATKTRAVIENCLGGVLFIDEAYALGNKEKGDSFSKECIDTLCEALSDHKDNLMVIIAGYEQELKNCFFEYNQGLESRFTWRFKTSDYNYKELYDIFIKKVTDAEWQISKTEPIKVDWFNTNIKYFRYFGRNIETLFAKTKIAHSRRVFCKNNSEKTIITFTDIQNGFELYKQNEYHENNTINFDGAEHMYL